MSIKSMIYTIWDYPGVVGVIYVILPDEFQKTLNIDDHSIYNGRDIISDELLALVKFMLYIMLFHSMFAKEFTVS